MDWTALTELAREHLVLPVLAWVLDETRAAPREVWDGVREDFERIARSNLALSSELIGLLAAFQSAGVAAIPIKGPALAEHLYGDVTLRSFSDLDLLIQRVDVLAVKQLLETRGYRLTSPLHWNSDAAVLRARDSQLSFAEPQRGIAVDLHWRLFPEYVPAAVEARQVWQALGTVAFAGGQIAALRPEHLLLFLAAHGAKHHWERLAWSCDVARLIRVERTLDWEMLWRQAAQSGTARMLAVSLALAQRVAGAALPASAVERIERDPKVGLLAAEIFGRLSVKSPGTSSTMESARFAWRMAERRTQALATIGGILFFPTAAEYRALRLPGPLYPLYYPFRALRLCAKYAGRALGFAGPA